MPSLRTVPGEPNGFAALIALIVTVVIVSVLATTLLSSPVPKASRDRTDYGHEELLDLMSRGVVEFEGRVGQWPGRLTDLPQPVTLAGADVCGRSYSQGDINKWDGPYIDRLTPLTGTPFGIGVARNSFTAAPIDNQYMYLILTLDGVAVEDAHRLDYSVDGALDAATGRIRWTTLADGNVTLTWYEQVRGKCN